MPLREYYCSRCGRVKDELYGNRYPKTLPCDCGGVSRYRFGAPVFRVNFRYGWDVGAGKYFNSARQRDNFLAEHNLQRVPEGVYDTPYGENVKEGSVPDV
jgi:hypothetical protein